MAESSEISGQPTKSSENQGWRDEWIKNSYRRDSLLRQGTVELKAEPKDGGEPKAEGTEEEPKAEGTVELKAEGIWKEDDLSEEEPKDEDVKDEAEVMRSLDVKPMAELIEELKAELIEDKKKEEERKKNPKAEPIEERKAEPTEDDVMFEDAPKRPKKTIVTWTAENRRNKEDQTRKKEFVDLTLPHQEVTLPKPEVLWNADHRRKLWPGHAFPCLPPQTTKQEFRQNFSRQGIWNAAVAAEERANKERAHKVVSAVNAAEKDYVEFKKLAEQDISDTASRVYKEAYEKMFRHSEEDMDCKEQDAKARDYRAKAFGMDSLWDPMAEGKHIAFRFRFDPSWVVLGDSV
jgi:hypothetical protein